MTARQLLKLPPEELAQVPPETVERILADERAKLDALAQRQRELAEAQAEADRPKTRQEIAERMGLSPERIRQIERLAILKIRDRYPSLRDLLQ